MRLIFFRYHSEGDAPEPGMDGRLKVWIGFHLTLQQNIFPRLAHAVGDEPFSSDIGALWAIVRISQKRDSGFTNRRTAVWLNRGRLLVA